VNKKDQSHERPNVFAVGDRIRVNLHTGRIVEATIKAVINRTDGPTQQVDFAKDETALIRSWQVVEKIHPDSRKRWVRRHAHGPLRNRCPRAGSQPTAHQFR
jgi:hypothetical protein